MLITAELGSTRGSLDSFICRVPFPRGRCKLLVSLAANRWWTLVEKDTRIGTARAVVNALNSHTLPLVRTFTFMLNDSDNLGHHVIPHRTSKIQGWDYRHGLRGHSKVLKCKYQGLSFILLPPNSMGNWIECSNNSIHVLVPLPCKHMHAHADMHTYAHACF